MGGLIIFRETQSGKHRTDRPLGVKDDLFLSLTLESQQRVRDKARWEHMSLTAVMVEWPDLMREE